MIQKQLVILSLLVLTTSCSLLPQREVKIVSKPVEIDIIQPTLPRPLELGVPKWYVVSEARITNPCKKTIPFDPPKYNDKGEEQLKRPKSCDLLEDRKSVV